MGHVGSPRIGWLEVPEHVRAAVEAELGAHVVAARSQFGGFSPGSADRVELSDGRRLFVKAVGTALNPDTPRLHRREAHALAQLPDHVPAPRLVATYDDGDWVALVMEDVEGRHPEVPWPDRDVDAVGGALVELAGVRAPASLPAHADIATMLTIWSEVAERHAAGELDERFPTDLVRQLDQLLDAGRLAREVTRGDALVHWDVRSDNVFVRDGEAVLLDWAWACRGAPWLDAAMLGLELAIQGADADQFFATNPLLIAQPREHVRALLVCAAGFWALRGTYPDPPGLPSIRAVQRSWAAKSLAWLRERGDL
ncbi:MAG: phosphotransferase family protein [Motilibacteraceae bacterium]